MKFKQNVVLRLFAGMLLVAAAAVWLLPGWLQGTENAVTAARRGVVQIAAVPAGGDVWYSGSGFGVGTPGKDTDTFVTNWHVVTDEQGNLVENVYIMLDDADIRNPDTMVACEVIYLSPQYPDLAILRAAEPVKGLKALPLLPSESVAVGSNVYALGYPGITDQYSARTNSRVSDVTVTGGVVSRFMELSSAAATRVILHDATINHGNSGGPLITPEGAVVGINTYGFGEQTSNEYSCSIYIDYAMQAMDELGVGYGMYQDTLPRAVVQAIAAAVLLALAGVLIWSAGHRATPARSTAQGAAAPAVKPAQPSGGAAYCVCATDGPLKGAMVRISERGVRIGRDPQCELCFPADTRGVSRRHCKVTVVNGTILLTDEGSSWGTFAGGKRIEPNTPVVLAEGTAFTLGEAQNAFAVRAWPRQAQ